MVEVLSGPVVGVAAHSCPAVASTVAAAKASCPLGSYR